MWRAAAQGLASPMGTDTAAGSSPDFFVSYTQTDRRWAEWVAWQLEAAGYAVLIQAWDFGTGANFVVQMDAAMSQAARTVLILSPDYLRSGFATAEWAGAFATDPTGAARKLLPLRVGAVDPAGLLAAIVWTDLVDCDESTALERLLAAASGTRAKPARKPSFPNATRPHFPPAGDRSGVSPLDATDGAEAGRFSESIREHGSRLARHIDQLTQEQARVLDHLRYLKRVRISGIPGSGKTLVAAEKAIRMARAGMATLFLCHNPRLADYVSSLTAGSPVEVLPFTQWVVGLTASRNAAAATWSNYDEPTDDVLGQAFDRLTSARHKYDAVVVDEGQDFRAEWWALVEAALGQGSAGVLYIFHDDGQALLPHRSHYPFDEPIIDLSRNCRNGGRIFELMKCACRSSPESEPSLAGLGAVYVEIPQAGAEHAAVQRALGWFPSAERDRVVMLFSGDVAPLDALLEPLPTEPDKTYWRDEVRHLFERACAGRTLSPPLQGLPGIRSILEALEPGALPSASDVELVQSVARQFRLDPMSRAHAEMSHRHGEGLVWGNVSGRPRLRRRRGYAPLRPTEIVLHFQEKSWADGLERIGQDSEAPASHLKPLMYRVSDFKGLEASSVLFIVQDLGCMPSEEFLVGISRATSYLAIVMQSHVEPALSGSIRRLLSTYKWQDS